jgi:hypothetical protein
MLVGVHPTHAGGGALADVAQQARPADLRRAPELIGSQADEFSAVRGSIS